MKLVADENLDNEILRAMKRRSSSLDLLRVQDVGLSGADDERILEWAAREDRVVITHDVNTMVAVGLERVRSGLPMPGLIVVHRRTGISRILEDLLVVIECSKQGEISNLVLHLPL